MAAQSFRSSIGGFNREDVVRYIEYLNNRHASQVSQLKSELETLQSELNTAHTTAAENQALTAQLEAANARISELEQELSDANMKLEHACEQPQTEAELDAYRRAERVERIAIERVTQMYDEFNGTLADATLKTEEAISQVDQLSASVTEQLALLQAAIVSGKSTLENAAAAMYAMKPVSIEE